MVPRRAFAICLPLVAAVVAAAPPNQSPRAKSAPPTVAREISARCAPCHSGPAAQGGLDLSRADFKPGDPANFALWVAVHDRVRDGEMPPPGAQPWRADQRARFLSELSRPLATADRARAVLEGRSVRRRMNRYEYENTVRDVLEAPWLQIREMLPEDGTRARFNKVGEALDVSHVQMARYLAAADYALREVLIPSANRPERTTRRYFARRMGSFVGLASFDNFNASPERATFPMLANRCDIPALEGKAPMTVGDANPAVRDEESMGVVASSYEPLEPVFDRFKAPRAGLYRLRVSAYSFWAGPESERRWWRPSRHEISKGRTREPVTLYAQLPPRTLRRLDAFDVVPETGAADAHVHTVDVWLQKGESIRPDAARLFRSRPPNWRNPLARVDGQPGVAFRWLEVEGPIVADWPTPGHRLLFGDLPVRMRGGELEVLPRDIDTDSARLVRGFVSRAWRRPASDDDVVRYVRLARTLRQEGASFMDAQLGAYAAVLCAPAFVTLEEKPGTLDSAALATRLSYFLWNSEPDAALRAAARTGGLASARRRESMVRAMLASPRADRFVEAFLDYWLDLRKVGVASPDETLYPDYYLDDWLVESSVAETRATFHEMIRSNRPVGELVDARWAMVNARMAELYGIPGVEGVAFRKVDLPKDSVRGGLLTQASVLKITANGTTTSPVLRGAWINERILGLPVPPPPKSVPAVEPDIRGATTIREQLAKHRSDPSCGNCHAKIDPAGFALENFDVFGGWRSCYRALGAPDKSLGRGKNGQPFTFGDGPEVDASGRLPDGRTFRDVRELKRLLASDDRALARNLVRQLLVYSTGAQERFADREAVERILDRARGDHYGVQSLIIALVESELFRNK